MVNAGSALDIYIEMVEASLPPRQTTIQVPQNSRRSQRRVAVKGPIANLVQGMNNCDSGKPRRNGAAAERQQTVSDMPEERMTRNRQEEEER